MIMILMLACFINVKEYLLPGRDTMEIFGLVVSILATVSYGNLMGFFYEDLSTSRRSMQQHSVSIILSSSFSSLKVSTCPRA